ncbi:MAG TPA: hypothetical protein VII39_07795 [Bradyrhizobium sp.]
MTKNMPGDVNENVLQASDRVHLREIVVTSIIGSAVIAASGGVLGRLPSADGVDISAATPTNLIQGRNHGD